MESLQIVILAAGQGTRMKSDLPKVLHPLGGQPVLHYVTDLAQALSAEPVTLVVSPSLAHLSVPVPHRITIQSPARGTGDAVKQALPHLKPQGHVLILYGDTPLLQRETLEEMLSVSQKNPAMAVLLLGMSPPDPEGYGRLIVNEKGELEDIVEQKDLTPSQYGIPLCNSGVILIRADLAEELLSGLTAQNAAQEYYLPDIVKLARQKGYSCGFVEGAASEFMGINTREDLAKAEAQLQDRWRHQALKEGVTLHDPSTTYFSYDTQLSADVTLHPCVVFGSGVRLEKGAEVLPFCYLSETHVGPYAKVGPFARLRGGVELQEKAEIGNFVEAKKSVFGPKAKAKHLSYIGDAEIGPQANIGAGTITCNYDGFKKAKTYIGEGAFIGSNSALVAPVSVGKHAIVGAGSVITQDVASDDLACARASQTAIPEGAKRFRIKRQKEKDTA